VSRFGIFPEPVRLIARIDGQPDFALTDYPTFSPLLAVWFINNSGQNFWSTWFTIRKPDPFVGFPYGWNVEPDHSP